MKPSRMRSKVMWREFLGFHDYEQAPAYHIDFDKPDHCRNNSLD